MSLDKSQLQITARLYNSLPKGHGKNETLFCIKYFLSCSLSSYLTALHFLESSSKSRREGVFASISSLTLR